MDALKNAVSGNKSNNTQGGAGQSDYVDKGM